MSIYRHILVFIIYIISGPAIIISNNINNELADTVTVIPITSSVGKVYPFEVFLTAVIANYQKIPKQKQTK